MTRELAVAFTCYADGAVVLGSMADVARGMEHGVFVECPTCGAAMLAEPVERASWPREGTEP